MKAMFHSLPVLILLLLVVSCSQTPKRPLKALLPHDIAIQRAIQLSNVSYDLFLNLEGSKSDYSGSVTLSFDFAKNNKPLEIDFSQGVIHSITINQQLATNFEYNKFFISLPSASLKQGHNTVTIEFSHPYSTTGFGLYRFKDPEDNNVFIYSDLEPYEANSVFPCFDQPDLKASYQLSVETPENWQVISARAAKNEEKLEQNGNKRVNFPPTQHFSTYLFPIHAGPYHIWESNYGTIPLRLFARPSIAKFVAVNEWLKVTQHGLRFYEDYFDYPYPFEKYDQVIVPDFNSGAMENVGAVTFAEKFVQRGSSTEFDRMQRANVILHEMAHMWFGNLVTMRWWNGLWLNESFATYMESLALAGAQQYKGAWRMFYTDMKQWAYWEDQLITTHPIELPVKNTAEAFTNFDGITYGKGASALKQIAFNIGDDKFQQGVRAYFKSHAFKNTELSDFINALELAAERNLDTWTKQWLETPSLNTLQVYYQCTDGKITDFYLEQSFSPDYPYLRQHRTQIALLQKKQDKVSVVKSIAVNYSEKITPVKALEGESCPLLVYPNYQDYDYIKVTLDPTTLENIKGTLHQIDDSFLRVMFWEELWGMVRDAKLSSTAFAEIVYERLFLESDYTIAKTVVEKVYGDGFSPSNLLNYLPNQSKDVWQLRFEQSFLERLQKAKPKSDFQKLWLDSYISVAQSTGAISNMKQILLNTKHFAGLEIDQDRRWNIVIRLNQMNSEGAEQIRLDELQRDESETGIKMALAAKVIQPTMHNKNAWFDKITALDNSGLSLARLKSAMGHIFPLTQKQLQTHFSDKFYNRLPQLVISKKPEYLSIFSSVLAPTFCTQESVNQMNQFIEANPMFPPVVKKSLQVTNQENKRCVAIHKMK